MNRQVSVVFFIASLLLSCNKQSELSKDFNCKTPVFKDLENVQDVKNLFSVEIPKTWKTNLFYDDIQSSIYTADTTKQLTETLLLDITTIHRNINFDSSFKLKQEQENLAKNLIKVKSEEINLLNKPTYFTLSKGKKGNYQYQISHFYIKINDEKFMLAKVEIYGDSLVNERMCNAFSLIEKIKINQ